MLAALYPNSSIDRVHQTIEFRMKQMEPARIIEVKRIVRLHSEFGFISDIFFLRCLLGSVPSYELLSHEKMLQLFRKKRLPGLFFTLDGPLFCWNPNESNTKYCGKSEENELFAAQNQQMSSFH